ncbi:hypothetical protein Ahy_B03g065720 [Arachis hypogaea]|uniref:Uncharacterized protein n=1 Tax=Arachis hypogaea TaxID=3818 RepID=A0A445A283_ARAHY|nr:hypothetical protein Ahy_B03g065720 [Arachis hypogaea]
MASDESFLVLVQYRGSIKKKTRFGIKFTDKDLLSVFLKPSTSFTEFQNTIIRKLGLQSVKRVEKLFYGILISVLRDDVKYDSFIIASSSGGSNRNLQPSPTAACSSSKNVGAYSSLPVIESEAVLVASTSFAADLNPTRDRERVDTGPVLDVAITMAGIYDVVLESRQGGALDGVKDVFQDEDDDDVEPPRLQMVAMMRKRGILQLVVVEQLVQELCSTPALFSFGLGCHETLYLSMASNLSMYGSHRICMRVPDLSPKSCVDNSIMMYALAYLLTVSSSAPSKR